MRTIRTVSAVMDSRWSQDAFIPNKKPKDAVSAPPAIRYHPQDEWYALVALEQAQLPVIVQ